jgi:hypothetical protein
MNEEETYDQLIINDQYFQFCQLIILADSAWILERDAG